MTDDVPLPELFEGHLDDETLRAFERDLLAGATHVEVRTKSVAASMGSSRVDLRDAMLGLREGRIPAVQLRYVHDGQRFVDTVMRTDSGRYRLVRMPEAKTLFPSSD